MVSSADLEKRAQVVFSKTLKLHESDNNIQHDIHGVIMNVQTSGHFVKLFKSPENCCTSPLFL